jgi:hypothetical protein
MRLFLSLVTVCALTQGCQVSLAQPTDCKTITDPATRLTCYDKINPPIATYPIPLPKTTARPLSMPQDGDTVSTGLPGEDDAALVARMNGICRGC